MPRVGVGKEANLAILSGELDLSVWSEEELIRGQRRAANGRWMGTPAEGGAEGDSRRVGKAELSKAYDLLNESIYDAVAVLREVALDKQADPTVRIKAATEILNRTMGKPTQEMKIAVQTTFEEAFEAMLVPDDEPVLDVSSWEDDDS